MSIIQAMEKRIPKSEKYAHIGSKLDTGPTINKMKVISSKEFAKRRDEIFYRITKHLLYELYNEYEADEREVIGDFSYDGNGPKIVTYSELSTPEYSKPYLILDVRESTDYNTCHLLHAKHFPHALLRRDQMLPEIYQFKNKEESLIIVYCDDERISRESAKVMFDRGIDNIFLLEGGLKEFCSCYPAFVEGTIPFAPSPQKPGLTRTSKISKYYNNNKRHTCTGII